MPVARCVKRCWDSQIPRRYWPGDTDNMEPDHVFIRTGCFVFVEPQVQAEVKAVEPNPQPLPEMKNPKVRGNPNWRKKEVST